ncbi:MAG: SDR family oxidoreductase [Alphaproteobacteria bacterium]|nr:SDR family oxidoreductase [Alphaproteobacteria bacterium]
MNQQRLKGRSAFITGAANGIGRAMAKAFAAEGAAVALADIQIDTAERIAGDIRAAGGRALAVACDVSDSAATKAAVEATVAAHGKLDILCANAAVLSPFATIEQLSEADWNKAIAVNLTGAFHACKHAIPHIRKAGGGAIILTASQMGRVANANQAVYCTTKGALLQLAKGLAIDHADDKIRVNTLSPGGIATDRMLHRFADMQTAQRVWGAKHVLGRLGEPEEMAKGAVFLASDESSFMTGADLLLDGGYTAW